MKILVVGRTGQLARSLAERAGASKMIDIVFVGRPGLDLRRPGAAAGLVRDAKPDVVINAAAYTDVDGAEDEPATAFRINADAAGEIAEAAARIGAGIIHVSTDYVFAGSASRPYREQDATAPINVYGASKRDGEEQVKAVNPNHVIVRTSWLVSPFGRNFVKTILAAARTRRYLQVVSDQLGRPTSALDLADAILTLASSRAFVGTLHLANTGETSWFGFARAIVDEVGAVNGGAVEVKPILSADWPTRARRPSYSVLDCSKAAQEIGLALPKWRTSLAPIIRRLSADA